MNNLQNQKQNSLSQDVESFWEGIKEEFILDPQIIHLSLSIIAPHPKRVRKMIDFHQHQFDSNPAKHYKNKDKMHKEVLDSASHYMGCPQNQIALTSSTTMGLSVVLGGMQIFPGEEILTTNHEHFACLEMLYYKVRDSQCLLKRIALYQDSAMTSENEILQNIVQAISDRTRCIVLTWVHSCTGVKLPLFKISEKVREINAKRQDEHKILLCVDGLHGFGVEDVTMVDLGVDFFIAGCHKSLFGPRGTGIIWGSELGWSRIKPIIPSFDSEVFWPWYEGYIPSLVSPKARLCSPGGFGAFEYQWSLGEAFIFHHLIGKDKIQNRIHQLKAYAQDKMSTIGKIKIHTPMNPFLSAGMVCFEVIGIKPEEVVDLFEKEGIMIGQTPYRQSLCRFSISILNDFTEIDYAVAVLQKICLACH